MTSKPRFTKKKKESHQGRKKILTGKKEGGTRSRRWWVVVSTHEAATSYFKPNPKNLQPNPAAASASPTLAASPSQPDNEETPLGPPATSEDPPPTKRQNPPHQQNSRDASLSRFSTKGGTPSSEQGDNEEMGSHGEPPTSREPNATEEQIMVRNHFEIMLKENFREDVEEVDDSCPRMCKDIVGEIYEKLGETKEISNILKPTGSESDLSVEIFDDGLWDDVELGDDGDRDDPIVDGWNKIIIHDQVKILWEDLYKMDVKTRKIEHEPERICEELEGPRVCEETEAGCESLETRVAQLESMEDDHNPTDRFGNMEDLFDHDRFDTGGGQENDDADKEATKDGENEHEKDSHVDADKEATKEGENEPEQMAKDDADKEATKEVENEPEHALQEDLEVMAAAAEKFEKEVSEKEAAEKEAVEKKASEKESTDEMDGDGEEDSPKKTKRVPKPSRMKQSPYVEK
ncbi:hypothetical protein Bca52824_076958 [Brassica carinata]|uniref:DUF287 domain-containing protein n=1 Tax=Brassica carinata TaxID=52824 RepID=A0A8X7PY42_BRACI|nr:hypothetical protein Bca52824_076958 [Brassica carinata]